MTIDKAMSALKVCTQCVLPETFPGVRFNEAGVCNFCLDRKDSGNRPDKKAEYREKLLHLRDKLIKGVQDSLDNVYLNGHPQVRLPNNVNMSFEFIESESLFVNLDLLGIACSSGSACTSDTAEPSHVLSAIGVPTVLARGSLRFSIGRWTTEENIDYLLSVLPDAVDKLRALSPLTKYNN